MFSIIVTELHMLNQNNLQRKGSMIVCVYVNIVILQRLLLVVTNVNEWRSKNSSVGGWGMGAVGC